MAEEEKNDLDLLGKFIKATGREKRADVPPYTVNNLRRLIELIRKEKGYLEEKRRLLDLQKAKGEIDRLQGFIDKYEEAVQKLLFNTVSRETDSDQASKTLKDARGDEIPPMTLNQLEELYTLIWSERHKLEEKIGKLAVCDGNAELLKDAKPTEQYEFSYVPTLEPIPNYPAYLDLVYDYDRPDIANGVTAKLQHSCFITRIGQRKAIYKKGDVKRWKNTDYMNIFLYPDPFCHDENIHDGTIYQQYTEDVLETDYKDVKQIPDKSHKRTLQGKGPSVFEEGKGYTQVERTLVEIQFKVDVAIKNCLDCPQKINPQNIDAKTAALKAGNEINRLREAISKHEAAIQKLLLRE